KARRESDQAKFAEIRKQYANDEAKRREEIDRLNKEIAAAMPKVTMDKIIEHIDHAVKIAGIDHVGLGSDFDGATMPAGMDDVSHLPRITEALLTKGYAERDIEKILGGNLLRVMEQNERISRELSKPGAK
ncbi:MAG TPA: membrane dipeptidase, partial [Candidatus Acidoferrales bacterium]|nr:membrane dipeptidase [Candidatus Acidoferrales bacterium]